MLVKSKRDNYASLYQWMTHEVTNQDVTTVEPVEFETEQALDTFVETMLNNDGYAKSDFVIVKLIDYTIDATDYDI
jgi:hypothetical protein